VRLSVTKKFNDVGEIFFALRISGADLGERGLERRRPEHVKFPSCISEMPSSSSAALVLDDAAKFTSVVANDSAVSRRVVDERQRI